MTSKKRNTIKLTFALVAAAFGFSGSAQAIVNPGFETGDFTGWTVNDGGLTSVVSSHSFVGGEIGSYAPVDGSFFARLSTGLGAGVYTTVSQSVSLNATEVLSGWAAFDAGDFMPFNDDAFVRVNGVDIWTSSVNSVGDFSHSPWQFWSFAAPVTGSYTLSYGVANFGDNGSDSFAVFDSQAVPDSGSTLVLLCSGLIVLFGVSRRSWGVVTR